MRRCGISVLDLSSMVGRHTVAPYFIAKTRMPPEKEETWLAIVALQEESEDPVEVRRRIRGKMGVKSIRRMEDLAAEACNEADDLMSTENAVNQAVAEQSEDRDEWDVRVRQTLEEEGGLMLSDQEDVMEMVFQKLVKLKKAVLAAGAAAGERALGEAHHGRADSARGRKGSPTED